MRIAIEAQRIFRKDKHGMDFGIRGPGKDRKTRNAGIDY